MPFEDSVINIETVQHPTLGPLKFPSDMPYEQRNQLIENLEAEQKAAAKAGFTAENMRSRQLDSRSQPQIAKGLGDGISIGARIFGQRPPVSQLYPPQLTATSQPEAASNRLPHALSFGVPPDRSFSSDRALGSPQYAETTNILLRPRSPQGFLSGNDQGNSFGSGGTNALNQTGRIGSRILSTPASNRNWGNTSGSSWRLGMSPEQNDRSLFAGGTQSSEPSAIQRNRYVAGLNPGRDLAGYSLADSQKRATNAQTTKPGSTTNATRGQVQGTDKSSGQTGNQPATIWMVSADGDLTRVPLKKYPAWLKAGYQLAIPLYLKNGVGVYVPYAKPASTGQKDKQDAFQEFMSKNYEKQTDFYQPGRRAVIQDAHGNVIREIIVPATNAEQQAQKQGATLLAMTPDEKEAFYKAKEFRTRYNQANQEKSSAEMRTAAQRSGGLTEVEPDSPWKPDENAKGRLMVPGAANPKQKKDNVPTYLPYVIDGLKWKFGDNSWQQYLPYTLATINAESSTFEPVTQGNSKSQTKKLGRGFIQLSADEYRIINDELNMAAKSDAEKVDLVHHPEQANDPKIAGRIMAQYLFDRLHGYRGKDARGRPAHRDGLSELIYGKRDPKVKPEDDPLNPEKAVALYVDWLHERNPKIAAETLAKLQMNPWVRARIVVNGHHANNLPNGLERYLPALIFADRHQKIVNAAQDPNSTMTLQEAANIWTGGLSNYGNKNYAVTLRKRLGLAPSVDLAAIRLSDLPPRMLKQMLNVEGEYAMSLENDLTRAQNQKHKASK